jgi:anti-sigma factor RsiW
MDGPMPHILNEDDLVAAVLDPDDLSAETRQHLAQCPICTERAASYRQFMSALTSKLYRWDCPTTQEISDYVAGELHGKRRRALTLHVKSCPHCAEELEVSRQFLAPASFQEAARPRLIAQLLTRQAINPELSGIRGDARENETGWPRSYQVDTLALSLDHAASSRGGNDAMLTGLISRAETPLEVFTDIEVHLVASGAPDGPPILIEHIDEGGNFALSPIPPGRFDLVIVLPEGDVIIEGLELSG